MSGLYLEEGEVFVVTTNRISVDFTQYDMMLTSKKLILLDSSHTIINPRKIPLSTVLAVNAGKTEAGEPVITLTFHKTEGQDEPLPMNLLFSQSAGEQRRLERDDWIKRLMEQIVALQQETLLSQPVQKEEESGIAVRPAAPMRRIDMPTPHKSVIRDEPVLVDLRVVPEQPHELPGETVPEPLPHSKLSEGDEEREAPDDDERFMGEDRESSESKTVKDQIPTDNGGFSEGGVTNSDIPKEGQVAPDNGPKEQEEKIPEDKLPETEPGPSVSGPNIPESLSGQSPEAISKEQPTGDEPESGSGSADSDVPGTFLPQSDLDSPAVIEPLLNPDTTSIDSGRPQEDGALGKQSDNRHEQKKPPFSMPSIKTLAAVAIIIIVLLAIAGGIILTKRFTPPSSALTPPPESVVTYVTATPAIPVPAPFIIPEEGSWLLVNGSFAGDYGRPGNLLHVSESGRVTYRIRGNPPLFQAIFRNQDTTGKPLLVEVYHNGTRVVSRSTNAPGGAIEFIINPITGEFPRVTPTPTSWTGLSPNTTYRI